MHTNFAAIGALLDQALTEFAHLDAFTAGRLRGITKLVRQAREELDGTGESDRKHPDGCLCTPCHQEILERL